jgi:hypothetical protein
MPLKSGGGKKNFVANIRELMHSFKHTRKIGNSAPASAAKANKQAVAIAYAQQRKGGK